MTFATSPEEIELRWLASVFERYGISGADLQGFDASRIGTGLIGDSYRLHLHWANESDVGAPATVIIKMAAADPTSRATGMALRNYEREVRFYQDLAPTLPIRVATCWEAEWDPVDGLFVLLLEDLSPAVVGDQLAGCSTAQAEAVIEMAARMHATHWGAASLDPFADWLSLPADSERALQLGGLWSMAWPQFLERHGARFTGGERATAESFGASIVPWVLDRTGPNTLVHGDFRIDNMLFGGTDSQPWVVPVDWQTPGIGPGVSDLAYFLGASLLDDDRREHEERLVRRWFDQLVDHGVRNYVWTDCWTQYRKFCFGGVVMGVVASMLTPQTDRGDEMFLAMATRHLRQAADHESLSLLATL